MTNLKRIRESMGMSQSQLSAAVGMSVRSLQDLEQGRRDINGAAVTTVINLARVLGCRIESLLEETK